MSRDAAGQGVSPMSAGNSEEDAARRETRIGVVYALAAYLSWGLVPIYFKSVSEAPALEVLAHRVLWATPMLYAILAWRGRLGVWKETVRDRRTLATLLITTVIIATNWLIFIWAVANDRLLEASLGYFINPLFSVVLGVVFLREKLRRLQWISVSLAALGVALLAVGHGQFPWVSLALAGSFGMYGLLRKTVRAEGMVGLSVETLVLWPAATIYIVCVSVNGSAVFGSGSKITLLLMAAGVVTALPLIWFTNAARRLRLATVGFLQYLAPTGQFLLAVVAYNEPFTRAHAVTFGLIWTALFIYSVESAIISRRAYATVRA